ncbi:MAG: phosphonoacetaldehyde hydrolase [Candidatus Aminicenantes bacterium]|nr:phosphonoacetaldehyde hydrolase [Candidatus Aminicenantes bacterium]
MAPRIQAVIFDWAGTTVDFGSLLPLRSLQAAFARFGLDVPLETVRLPMGAAKDVHIRSVLGDALVSRQWLRRHGRAWHEGDVRAVLDVLETEVRRAAAAACDPVPGLESVLVRLRRRGIRIGSTTGYTRRIMEILMPAAERKGYAPDCVVCSDEVRAGRPAPWMMFRNAEILGVSRMSRVVKAGDTPVDMAEGFNAGAWSVGVVDSSSLLSLGPKEFETLSPREKEARRRAARKKLFEAGAHYVVNTLSELPGVIEDIELRLELAEEAAPRPRLLIGAPLAPARS